MESTFLKGIEHFNRQEFFEAHEVWEAIWRSTPGSERELYHGLIQVAVACLHLTRGHPDAAEYELSRARVHLAPFLPRAHGIDLAALLQQVEACLVLRSAQGFPIIPL